MVVYNLLVLSDEDRPNACVCPCKETTKKDHENELGGKGHFFFIVVTVNEFWCCSLNSQSLWCRNHSHRILAEKTEKSVYLFQKTKQNTGVFQCSSHLTCWTLFGIRRCFMKAWVSSWARCNRHIGYRLQTAINLIWVKDAREINIWWPRAGRRSRRDCEGKTHKYIKW